MMRNNTRFKSQFQEEDMSNDAEHVYFLQKKKAEILARKNREKAGFEPSALLKFGNDGSFLERFNKMMQQRDGKGKQHYLYQNEEQKQDISKTFSPTHSHTHCTEIFFSNQVEEEIRTESSQTNTNKRKMESDLCTNTMEADTVAPCNGESPSKIQRFSMDELAKLIQVKKPLVDPLSSKERSTKRQGESIECKRKSREKTSDKHSSRSRRDSRKREERTRENLSSHSLKRDDRKSQEKCGDKISTSTRISRDDCKREEKGNRVKVSTSKSSRKSDREKASTSCKMESLDKKMQDKSVSKSSKVGKESKTKIGDPSSSSLQIMKQDEEKVSVGKETTNEDENKADVVLIKVDKYVNKALEKGDVPIISTSANKPGGIFAEDISTPDPLDRTSILKDGSNDDTKLQLTCDDNVDKNSENATQTCQDETELSRTDGDKMPSQVLLNSSLFSITIYDREPIYLLDKHTDCYELTLLELIPQVKLSSGR